MEVLKYILIAFEVLASIALIVAVLLQSGKEAGLSGAIAGNNDSYMGKGKGNKLDKLLAASTKWIALAWLALTLFLNLL
jgi:preprotein translocase subunit SecG